MTIVKKLRYGFGGMVAMVTVLALVNLGALLREHAAKKNNERSFQVLRETSALQYELSQNQIHLSNYLLSGDASEAEKVLSGAAHVDEDIHHTEMQTTAEERAPLDRLKDAEHDWTDHFARPLIEKRKQVDSGNGTVAELQIFYLQQNPGEWLRKVKDPIDETVAAVEFVLTTQQASDQTKGTLMSGISLFLAIIAIGGGIAVAYLMPKSITDPLLHLML